LCSFFFERLLYELHTYALQSLTLSDKSGPLNEPLSSAGPALVIFARYKVFVNETKRR
jgi:hypothetical protein